MSRSLHQPSVLGAFGLGLVLAFSAGCARTAEERQLDQLAHDIDDLQASQDREVRKSSVELRGDEDLGAKKVAPAASGAPAGPRVVRLNPDGTEVSSSSSEAAGASTIDDDAPRPVIRVQGAPGSKRRNGDVVELTMPDDSVGPPITNNAPKPSALDPEAKRSYDAALALVNAKQYDKGLEALAAFLVRYPDHPYAANATYWRGECYFAEGQYLRAIEQFEGILARYPLGNKTPDALLKLGLSYQKLGNAAKAKTYFDKLQADYPRSDAVKLIPTASAAPEHTGATVKQEKK